MFNSIFVLLFGISNIGLWFLWDSGLKTGTRAYVFNSAPQQSGDAYNNKGQYDRAISDYAKILEINPKYAKAYVNLGINTLYI